MIVVFLFFFFFKQKTAYEVRISDWSSDVCSSDLGNVLAEYMNGALLRRDLPGCRAQQRGLARARAAHHGDHLPAPDLKVDALQHREVAIAQRDIGEAYKGIGDCLRIHYPVA